MQLTHQRQSGVSAVCVSLKRKIDPVSSYQDRNSSFAKSLVYVENDGKVIMRGDNYTYLADGVNRAR